MRKMVRKQIYIEAEQEELLKQRARELGVSEAELIRHGIDKVGRAPVALAPDRRAWQEELSFIRGRARILATQGGERGWTREELYEERLQKFSR